MIARLLIISWILLASRVLLAQERVTTVGIQFKPMFSNRFLGVSNYTSSTDEFSTTITPRFGMNLGMVIRKGLTKNWSLETGICFVQRNFEATVRPYDLGDSVTMNYRIIAYEIPIQGLIFVKLGDQLYMNASGGCSMDFYPSNVESYISTSQDTNRYDISQKTWRRSWLQPALLANYGFEWRTKSNGSFYAGVTYHRPFQRLGTVELLLEKNQVPSRDYVQIKGSYFTFDVKYFFHEKPSSNRRSPS
ncbi:MAG: outer membrane beta-barrel protein [Flavobacteriales bacterium]